MSVFETLKALNISKTQLSNLDKKAVIRIEKIAKS